MGPTNLRADVCQECIPGGGGGVVKRRSPVKESPLGTHWSPVILSPYAPNWPACTLNAIACACHSIVECAQYVNPKRIRFEGAPLRTWSTVCPHNGMSAQVTVVAAKDSRVEHKSK